jgi:hypothetical protein
VKPARHSPSDYTNHKEEDLVLTGADFRETVKQLLEKNADVRFQARGFSMSPFIKDGDVIVLSPLNHTVCAYGDVVALVHPVIKRTVVHRVVGRGAKDCLIKGDNIFGADGRFLRSLKKHIADRMLAKM